MPTLTATGHRPQHIHLPQHGPYPVRQAMLYTAQQYLRGLLPDPDLTVIIGMAIGWDIAVGKAALSLGIPLIAAIPFPAQPARWAPADIVSWRELKDRAAEVHIISPDYSAQSYQIRNQWMVDRADQILACWNGNPSGGTWNCIKYAQTVGKPVLNLWPQFAESF